MNRMRHRKLGQLLRRLRTAHGFRSGRCLAISSGMSPAVVRNWERGEFRPRWALLCRILDTMGATKEERDVVRSTWIISGLPRSWARPILAQPGATS